MDWFKIVYFSVVCPKNTHTQSLAALQHLQGSKRQPGPGTDGLMHDVRACEHIIYVTDRISVRKHFLFYVSRFVPFCASPSVSGGCCACICTLSYTDMLIF